MEEILRLATGYWWLGFFIVPAIGAAFGAIAKENAKRRRDRIELERVRRAPMLPLSEEAGDVPLAPVPAAAPEAPQDRERQIARILSDHDEVDRRWLDFELDVAKLIDYPLVTDMREPLTQAFHRAKRVADGLRPADVEHLHGAGALEEYRDAVRDYEVAFEAAVREAKRRAQTGFSDAERTRLATAQRLMALAENEASTTAERQSAYKQARRALDGLIALPEATTRDIEERIAGELEA